VSSTTQKEPPATRTPSRFGLGALLFVLAIGIGAGIAVTVLLRPPQQHDMQAIQPAKERKPLFYRSPMNPNDTSPVPKKDDMGMDYVPVYPEDIGAQQPVAGFAGVRIDPERQQLIGLTTATATQGPIGGVIPTVGRVAIDETKVRHVNVKVGGFVEQIFVDFVGKPVVRGQKLFTLYSPDLVSAQNEYLLALDTQRALSRGGSDTTGTSGDLVAAARERLRLWDIPDSEIAELERTRQPKKALTLNSPISGVVTQKSVVQGMRLNPGDMPYEITDLSEVWVLADAYETDLPRLAVGLPATFTTKSTGFSCEGKVSFIDPLLDPKTRTAKVRMQFANPTGELRPELFGDVVLHTPGREGVRIPNDAIVSSGLRQIVFISRGDGKFEPREVETGVSDGTLVEVKSGVAAGESVVTRANFLVDSESRLKAALGALGKPDGGEAAP
jgi:Cu(I)/Ag(I) efflux system membrane fusion protein